MEKIYYILKDNDNGLIKVKEFEYIDGKSIGLTTDMFLNVEEIVHDIITNRLTEDTLAALRNFEKESLIEQHFGFGRWIRNAYGLWLPNNPLTEKNPASDSNKHPDNLSFEIMKMVVKTLQNEHTPNVSSTEENFDIAMKIVGGE